MCPVVIQVKGILQLCLIETHQVDAIFDNEAVDYLMLFRCVEASYIEADHLQLLYLCECISLPSLGVPLLRWIESFVCSSFL